MIGAAAASSNRQAGFTLMELLVAITLLSLLSLVLTTSLRFGLTAWARGSEHAEGVDQTVLLQDVLRRTVGDAYPYFHPTDPTHELGYVDFSGTAGSMHFLASAPQALGGRGRVRFAIELERNSSGTELVVTTTPELAEGSAKPERKLLLSHVEDVEFAYFGKKRSQREAIWHNAWTGEPTLPQLVRVRVRAASSDVRTWPDLLIAPRLTADVGCVHDPLTKQCRGR